MRLNAAWKTYGRICSDYLMFALGHKTNPTFYITSWFMVMIIRAGVFSSCSPKIFSVCRHLHLPTVTCEHSRFCHQCLHMNAIWCFVDMERPPNRSTLHIGGGQKNLNSPGMPFFNLHRPRNSNLFSKIVCMACVCVCVCVCVYIYIYTHSYVCVCVHTVQNSSEVQICCIQIQ